MEYTATGNTSSNHLPSVARNPFHHQPIMIPISHSGSADDEFPRRDGRFPQWSNQETRDFIQIRAQLEFEFTSASRADNLWEIIANTMRDKGYRRTAHQCKCKWENLVTLYKGEEASDVDNVQQCPFFNELHAFFTMRAHRMQQAQGGGIVKGKKRLKIVSEEEFAEEEEVIVAPKRKDGRRKMGENSSDVLKGMMRNFMVQQERIDKQWREMMEKKAEEREAFEEEWRQKMERLERERLMMERAWRDREEQRRLREETRAEKRDALLSTLLDKLIHDQTP